MQVENYSTYNNAYFKEINQFTIEIDTLDVERSEIKNEGTPDYDLSNADATGTIDGYTWSVCGDTLVISGESESKRLADASAISAYAETVKKIIIENSTQITRLGDSLFSGFSACETVVIPAKLNTIGSKTFENMTALTTVAVYNDYYGENFEGNNVIDLYDINYFSADSFSGAVSADSCTIRMPIYAKFTGDAQKFVLSNAIYYIYPSGEIADMIRETASSDDSVRYYTYAMTGEKELVTEGVNSLKDVEGDMFTWSFDNNTGKLSLNFLGGDVLYMCNQGFNDWKNVWKEAVTSIEVYGTGNYNKIQIYAKYSGNISGIFDGYKNLVSIYFDKYGSGSVAREWQKRMLQ